MPSISTQIPDRVGQEFLELRQGIDTSPIPKKKLDRHLLIATWNLRAFVNTLLVPCSLLLESKLWADFRLPLGI